MKKTPVGVATSEAVVLTVLTQLKNGQIHEAVDSFAEEFKFQDHGIGLEFDDKERLTEFFQKARELYPDSVLFTETIFASADHLLTEWILRFTLTEPFFGGLTRKLPISIHGVSVVRTEDGKITRWSDYYDGLTARRTALGACFEEWVEL